MTNFDGVAEEAAILAKLGTLTHTGQNIFDDAPDPEDVPADIFGHAAPYIVASFGVPFRAGSKNTAFADTERSIPYTMTMVFGIYAGTKEALNDAYSEFMDAMLGFEPNGDNAMPLSIPYAYNQSQKGVGTLPSIFGKVVTMVTTINLSPSA